jgi:Mrp family chromosome partitioning ATPase
MDLQSRDPKAIEEVIDTLCSLAFGTVANRQACLLGAFGYNSKLYIQISYEGASAADTATLIVNQLRNYGSVTYWEEEKPALWVFMHYLTHEKYGEAHKKWFKDIGGPYLESEYEKTVSLIKQRSPSIHIILSSKGGVGKTLITLSTIASYTCGSLKGRRLLVLDLNVTTQPEWARNKI